MTDKTRKAEKLLAQIYRRFLLGWSVIENLRNLAEASQAQRGEIATANAANALHFMETNKDYRILSGSPLDESGRQEIVAAMAEGAMGSYMGSIRAACLVFWHSVLDAATTDLCRVIALASPASWDSQLSNRKICFVEAAAKSTEELRAQLLCKLIKDLENKSLSSRIAELYARCGPEADWSNVRDYSYDRYKLERIDKLRQGIVHREGLHEAAQLDPTDTDYLRSTTLHLIYLVAYHFKLQVEIGDVYGSTAVSTGSTK